MDNRLLKLFVQVRSYGQGGDNYRLSIPSSWCRDMGFSPSDRYAYVSYDSDLKCVIIRFADECIKN